MTRKFPLVTALAAAVAITAPATLMSAAAAAQDASLNIGIDQARRVQLRGSAGSVIVGNPQIADVTVVDSNTLFITGKGYGVTEVVAVDPNGRVVYQSQVVVTDSGTGRVRVWRGREATEMACSASCAPSVRSGDIAVAAPAAAAAPAP